MSRPSKENGERKSRPGLAILSLTALGVVYGDIGTSPIYALRECFSGEFGIAPEPSGVLGVLSLVFWALMLVVSLKYLTFVLRADNHGEGGVIALTALLRDPEGEPRRGTRMLLALGLFAASLLYGDGMITPAISVLSAVEGLSVFDPTLEQWVLPITVAILVALFAFQHKGTARVGVIFGPVTLLWFVTIGILGLVSVVEHPGVLRALSPTHGIAFLAGHGRAGFLVLGAVFLVVTGTEALYADMGHFGLPPIRRAWLCVVLPGLLSSYFGQGALILGSPESAQDPFFALAPSWLLAPLIFLATLATIIASQAVISGSFSLTRQAIQLGYCPRMRVVQTSSTERGQVYVPQINWILMVATIGLVLGFQSSSHLAAAYGVAVTSTMLITTLLFSEVARKRFGWSLGAVLPLGLSLLVVDAAFFGANITKVFHGAWFPLVIGGVVFVAMTTWRKGRLLLGAQLQAKLPRDEDFVRMTLDAERVDRQAVFLTSDPEFVPPAVLHNLKHNRILHARTIFMNIKTEDVPRVPRDDKIRIKDLGQGFYRVSARYGFYETPNVPHALAIANEQGLDVDVEEASFFLGRERVRPSRRPGMSRWRESLFAFLDRNSLGATAYYGIPTSQVVEIGAQVQL